MGPWKSEILKSQKREVKDNYRHELPDPREGAIWITPGEKP